MNTWTRQKGYPVLTLDRNGSTYTVTQERFLTDPEVVLRGWMGCRTGYCGTLSNSCFDGQTWLCLAAA